MKYKVQMYCKVPDSIKITPRMKWALKYNKLVANGFRELEFSNESVLYHYVREQDYVDSTGKKKNHILEAMMTHPNDNRRHKVPFDDSRHPRPPVTYYYLGYLVKDEYDRTIDLRNYEKELYKFDYVGYDNSLRKKRHIKYLEQMAECSLAYDNEWKKRCRLLECKDYWGGLKRYRTIQERRYACDKELKPYFRCKRRNLPEPWGNEKPICVEKTWKARTKVNRQWQVNLTTHIDTIRHEKRTYNENGE